MGQSLLASFMFAVAAGHWKLAAATLGVAAACGAGFKLLHIIRTFEEND